MNRRFFSRALLGVAPVAALAQSDPEVGSWYWATTIGWNLIGNYPTSKSITINSYIRDRSVNGVRFTVRLRERGTTLSATRAVIWQPDRDEAVVSLQLPLAALDPDTPSIQQYENLDWVLVEILRESGTATKKYEQPTLLLRRAL